MNKGRRANWSAALSAGLSNGPAQRRHRSARLGRSAGIAATRRLAVAAAARRRRRGEAALVTVALGYAASFTPNIWSIIESGGQPHAVGSAAAFINGIVAGGGGTLAGFLVGLLFGATGTYVPGFSALGGLVILSRVALLIYRRVAPAATP